VDLSRGGADYLLLGDLGGAFPVALSYLPQRRSEAVTVISRTTVEEVLASFESEFVTFVEAFCHGQYVLWLGSGISRGVVPGVPELLQRMLEFLRLNISDEDPECRFNKALGEVLDVAGISGALRASLDFSNPVATWPALEEITSRLVDRYSYVLNVQVRDEAADFLVWAGLDVPATYGDPSLEPDVEHFCIALLMLEGVVQSAPTTNWDGLVEAAMHRIVGDADRFLNVVVTPEDFRTSGAHAELVKFHGCAVRAAADEAEYRSRLIARTAQISGWTTKPENELMKNHLVHLFASRSGLFLGLSAQDANIHTVLNQAIQNLVRHWPESPPAVVFAEQRLHHHHQLVLQVTYGDSYPPNAEAIAETALLGAYAKPVLVALVLVTVTEKLCALVGYVSDLSLSEVEIERLRSDVRRLRDILGKVAESDLFAFVNVFVSGIALALAVFRTGRAQDTGNVLYQPLSTEPVVQALGNPDFPAATLGRLAVVVSLLGRGLAEGLWTIELGSADNPRGGIVRVATPHRTSRLFMVDDSRSLSQLELDGVVDPAADDVLVLQARAIRIPTTRSPRARYGRTGQAGACYVDLEVLCGTVDSADALLEAFRLEGAL
jgi:hypothetical protein